MADRISKAIQENLIVLLAYDAQNAPIIRNTASLSNFEASYKEVAERCYEYFDTYGEPPGDTLADLFEDKLESDKKQEARHYKRLLFQIRESRESVNARYTMDNLLAFVRRQTLKQATMEAMEVLYQDTDDAEQQVEDILSSAMRTRLDVFDPGTRLTDFNRSLAFLHNPPEAFPTGVEILDRFHAGPSRRALHLFIGLSGRGKTFWLVNVGKRALMRRHKVLHISLEMSEEWISQRYYQALFALAKHRDGSKGRVDFEYDELGRVIGFNREDFKPKISMDDPDVEKKLKEKVNPVGKRINNLIIKDFPSGSLTIHGLKAYLDNLEQSEGFIPDIILLDYIDIMKIDEKLYRFELDRLYKEVRGIADERNVALATVSQSNRDGLKQKRVHEGNVAEAFTKIAHADAVLTYNQTEQEKALSLARLYAAKTRGDKSGYTVLINQDYNTGQFCRQSALMASNYWDVLDAEGPGEEG